MSEIDTHEFIGNMKSTTFVGFRCRKSQVAYRRLRKWDSEELCHVAAIFGQVALNRAISGLDGERARERSAGE